MNSITSNMSLPNLPPELLHIIFNYLDTRTILYSVRPTCKQLLAVVKTYNRLQLNFDSFRMSNSELLTEFIQPENVISLKLVDSDEIELFQLDQFIRLQSLTLIEIKDIILSQFFQHIIKYPLKTLSITTRTQTLSELRATINLLLSTITQSGLQTLHLDISNVDLTNIQRHQKIIFDTVQPVLSVLQHLKIPVCHYPEYHQILPNCALLQTLIIEDCTSQGINRMVLPSSISTSYLKLTSLTFYQCSMSSNELHSLLSFTPSLVHLKLMSERSYDPIFDGHLWEEFISTKLLLLETFAFFFACSPLRVTNDLSLNSIIHRYRTQFWLKDKHWIVNCDYIITSSRITVYTIPNPTDETEIVIRYDPSLINNCYRLLSRHWSNDLKPICTEQTLTTLDLTKTTINDTGAYYLATILENNVILTSLKLRENQLTIEGIIYIAGALQYNKTLITLYLQQNFIDNDKINCLTDALEYNTTLTTLDLQYNQMRLSEAHSIVNMLQHATTLTTLNIQNNQIGDQGAQLIANALNKNTTLQILSLEQNKITSIGAKYLAEGLKNNTALITLDLLSNVIGDEGVQHFANTLQCNTTLTTLSLAYSRIGTLGIKYLIDALRINKTLTTLNIGLNTIDTQGAQYLKDILQNSTTLTTLILEHAHLGPTGVKYLADALETNTTLTTIDLRANNIGPLGAKYLSNALKINATLTTLYLRGNSIGPSGAEHLTDMLQKNKTLITLILENNGIEDQGIEYLAKALENNETLKTLNLTQNDIRTTGAKHVANILQNNKILTTLILSKNEITSTGAKDIAVALSNNMIITTLDIQGNHSINQNILNTINDILERNQKLLEEKMECC